MGGGHEVPTPGFAIGQAVRVRQAQVDRHIRTPGYVMGFEGRVESRHGPFRDPETLAYGGSGRPPQWLYCVRIPRAPLWRGEDGAEGDVLVDLFESWLEATPTTVGSDNKRESREGVGHDR